MQISKIHIDKDDYTFFSTLEDKEKIEFLYDVQSIGLNLSIVKRIEKDEKELTQSLNDIFQDTMMDELFTKRGKLVITTMNNYIHLNSDSLKMIKSFVHKLIDDGHIIMRHKNAKKLSSVDPLRYYRCYEIIGSGDPFCPN